MKPQLQWLFWLAFTAFVAWDLSSSAPIDRFAEPAAIAAGSGTVSAGGHCSEAPE